MYATFDAIHKLIVRFQLVVSHGSYICIYIYADT